ncbi:predicted protein [Histoplasma capsulatum var. duboisii H88]|uniref:Predicted protein n=2 Tax=Ajellomyces capsulatus TaxID=5037 RepID=F0UKJ5_AJEC8|nr:predicted protein [Histoplasma capsulatum H143]EGC45949.1 predicted protein [Histoplasma capsulatum var. duboisii H88]
MTISTSTSTPYSVLVLPDSVCDNRNLYIEERIGDARGASKGDMLSLVESRAVPLISLIAGNRYCHPWPANGRAMVDTTPISRRRDRGRESAQKFSSGRGRYSTRLESKSIDGNSWRTSGGFGLFRYD